jgi:hypothetical protein
MFKEQSMDAVIFCPTRANKLLYSAGPNGVGCCPGWVDGLPIWTYAKAPVQGTPAPTCPRVQFSMEMEQS